MSNPQSPTILQRYHLLRKIATGGMAEVYLAEQTGAGGFKKRVAIKKILPSFAEDQKFVEMFLDEARLAAMFHHPNLIQIYELGEMDGLLCLVMEYVRGLSLSALVKRAHAAGQPRVSPELAARIMAQACDGLQYAHDFADPDSGQPLKLVHRDVSPQNILVSTEGIVKVMDFGIAKAAGQIHHTNTGTLKGKLSYMPPEQLNGRPLDRRADVWALGVVLYELLAGRRPFVGDSEASILRAILMEPLPPLGKLVPDLPAELVAVVDGALTRDLERRTGTAGEMARGLEDWLQTRPRTGQAEVGAWMKPLLPAPDDPSSGQAALTPSNLKAPPLPPTMVMASEAPTRMLPPGAPAPLLSTPFTRVEPTLTVAPKPPKRPFPWATVAVAAGVTVAAGVGIAAWSFKSAPEAPKVAGAPATAPVPVTPPPAPAPAGAVAAAAKPPVAVPAAVAPSAPVARSEKRTRRRMVVEPALANVPEPPKAIAVEAVNPPPPPETSGPMGSLVVNTEPWSRVSIDGRDVGQTPLAGLALKPGRHEMICTNPDNGLVHRETVVIPPGGRVKRFFQLAGGE
jgi:serine/threonine-protein kinase